MTTLDEDMDNKAKELAEANEKIASYESLPPPPSKEEILSSLSDDEIVEKFSQKVALHLSPDDALKQYTPETLISYIPFVDILNHLIQQTLNSFNKSNVELKESVQELCEAIKHIPSAPTPKPVAKTIVPKLPRVTIIGLLADQQNKIQNKLLGKAQFHFVDKNRKPDSTVIPEGQDIVLLAANFVSHAMCDQAKRKTKDTKTKLIVHHGGIESIIKRLNEELI